MLDELKRIELYKQLNPNELLPHQFIKLVNEIKNPDPKTISDERFDFKLWCNGFPSRQEYFARYISKRLAGKNCAKILEVGCGRTGILSRMLSEKGYCMTAIDPKLDLSSNSVKKSNVRFIKNEFSYKTFDLSEYDYVIAQEPCDATEHIVRACTTQNVPFIMILCGVPHRLISGEMPKDVEEWYNYLLEIDHEHVVLRYAEINPVFITPILKSNKF